MIDLDDICFGILVLGLVVYFVACLFDMPTNEQIAFKQYCLASEQADKNRDTEFCKKGWPK